MTQDLSLNDAPISADAFAALMARFERAASLAAPIAVAVSGGPDSMALLRLCLEWAAPRGATVYALTVDHALRPDSAGEAEQARSWAEQSGATAVVLTRSGDLAPTRLQEEARADRYRLLCAWCAAEGVATLLVAHTADDQAETVLARLARGAGLDGLAGMRDEVLMAAGAGAPIRVIRPLLGCAKARLTASLDRFAQPFIEDPGNENPAFERVRLRAQAGVLDELGLSRDNLIASASKLGAARDALDDQARGLFDAHGRWSRFGEAVIARAPLEASARDIARRVVEKALAGATGAPYPPARGRQDGLLEMLQAQQKFRTTLGGAIFDADEASLTIRREPAALLGRSAGASPPAAAMAIRPGDVVLWDRRFAVSLAGEVEDGADLAVAALGAAGAEDIDADGASIKALATLPALWRGDRLVAQPQLGYVAQGEQTGAFRAKFIGAERFAPLPVIRF